MAEEPKTCAACGEAFTHPGLGKFQDFHSVECKKMGRAFCLQCDEPLSQPERGPRRDFCDNNKLCYLRYYHMGGPVSPLLFEERNRSTCKACGRPIPPGKNGTVRLFCCKKHAQAYHQAERNGYSLNERWGNYPPITRKALRNVEAMLS